MPPPISSTPPPGSGSDPPRSTSIRPLAKILGAAAPVWAISAEGRIAYVSAACGQWLGVPPEVLLGRGGRGTTIANPLDELAAALLPAAEALGSAATVRMVYPPVPPAAAPSAAVVSPRVQAPQPRKVLFIPLADAQGPSLGVAVIAVADVGLPTETLERGEYRSLMDSIYRHLATGSQRSLAAVTLGDSVWAARLRNQIQLASGSSTHVTLCGPPGSGSAAVAKMIHDASVASRTSSAEPAAGAVPNPPAIVSVEGPLMDAELFDAATGSIISRLMDADAFIASLLVHDIDQMPNDAQQRLELLVSNYPQRLRLFVTTSRSSADLTTILLPSLAQSVGVLEIQLPSLSKRVEDIAIIAAALLHRRRVQGETRAAHIAREALDRLILYPWPGNFDELDGAIRNAVRQCRGETVQVEHLPLAIRSYGHIESVSASAPKPKTARVSPLDEAMAEAERRCITAALEQSRGNRAAAARLLDISRPRLLRRIEQLSIVWPPA